MLIGIALLKRTPSSGRVGAVLDVWGCVLSVWQQQGVVEGRP